jgi:hypothetical protein
VSAEEAIARETEVNNNTSTSFMDVDKSVLLPKGTTLKEMCVNRCKVIYICVIN